MTEYEEFADALIDQLAVETNEESVIADTVHKIKEDTDFNIEFESLQDITGSLFDGFKQKAEKFLDIQISDKLNVEYLKLDDFKKLKSKKVFAVINSREFVTDLFDAVIAQNRQSIAKLVAKDPVRFFVYSTYAKSYLSKITTTYGDYFESKIYLNSFILASYPQIVLYKIGAPFENNQNVIKSGYVGALKRTILEEIVHSTQSSLHESNMQAAISVNSINEELAKIILALNDNVVEELSEYLQLQVVPKEFPIAQRANLFFMLNPDNFVVSALGPEAMTYSRIEIDPKIAEFIPQLADIYQRWLLPIQQHHASFTASEGMAEFAVQNILSDDLDFKNYITKFTGIDESAYWIKKNIGRDFIEKVYNEFKTKTFNHILDKLPSSLEIKDPSIYIKRTKI